MTDATLTTIEDAGKIVAAYAHNQGLAAQLLGVSTSTIRRTAKRLGVTKLRGPGVAGFIRFPSSPVDVLLPYSEAAK
jgi:hypothetical protein